MGFRLKNRALKVGRGENLAAKVAAADDKMVDDPVVGAVVAVTSAAVLIRLTGLGRREGYWSLAWLAAFLLLSLSESVLMRHQDLPWTLFMALMARNLIPDRAP